MTEHTVQDELTGRNTVQEAPTPAIPAPITDVAGVLRAALVLSSEDETWVKQGKKVTIQYEFIDGDDTYLYYSWLDGPDWAFEPGSLPDDDCDIILRTSAGILGGILSGRADGREAITNGKMTLRKAPPMPTLMLMRGIFTRYTKAQARGTRSSAEEGKAPSSHDEAAGIVP